jgi:hypothetical protein
VGLPPWSPSTHSRPKTGTCRGAAGSLTSGGGGPCMEGKTVESLGTGNRGSLGTSEGTLAGSLGLEWD